MVENNFVTLLAVVLFAFALAYWVPFMHNVRLGYLSILQVMYLVVIPGVVFPLTFSYINSITTRPLLQTVVLSDQLLVQLITLSLFYAYGGISIHTITKIYAHTELRHDDSELAKMNRFFHLTFSHNMVYLGLIVAVVGTVLLELNHVPSESGSVSMAVIKGLGLGVALILSMYSYTSSKDAYSGRWNDLRFVFMLFWVGFVMVVYGIRKIRPDLGDYQLLLPILMSMGLLGLLNTVLVVRRVKRKWWVGVRWKRLVRYLRGRDET